jgi:hypothetical protein
MVGSRMSLSGLSTAINGAGVDILKLVIQRCVVHYILAGKGMMSDTQGSIIGLGIESPRQANARTVAGKAIPSSITSRVSTGAT